MKFALVLALLLLFGCGDSGHDTDLHDNDFERSDLYDDALILERLGMPDCQGTIPLEDIPLASHVTYDNRLFIEHDDNGLTVIDEQGYFVIAGIKTRQGIVFQGQGVEAEIESWPPVRFDTVTLERTAYYVDDGAALVIEEYLSSHGQALHNCSHEFVLVD